MKKISALFLLILFTEMIHMNVYGQQLTLIEFPFQLVSQTNLVRVRWLEPVAANFQYGTEHGKFNQILSKSGSQIIEFIPSEEGLAPGIYFCRVSDGISHSPEFPLIIEFPQSPVTRSPVNGAVIQSISSQFEWNAVAGVPFYHLILSDQPVVIKEDNQGELRLEGANIIYQVITNKTEITYGESDASGFFNQVNAIIPPLLEGKEYNWIVLNNYGGIPELSSIVQSGLQGFTVDLNINLGPPNLLQPPDTSSISSENIDFSWQSVNGAKTYQFELFELLTEQNSSSTFPVWQRVTTQTQITIPIRQIGKNSEYQWQVIALDETGKGSASEKREFLYKVPFGEISIRTKTASGNTLSRTNIHVEVLQGSGENNDYLTSDSGVFTLNVQPGRYSLTAIKQGFHDSTLTVEVEVNQSKPILFELKILPRSVFGIVQDILGNPISRVNVVTEDGITGIIRKSITDFSGGFNFPLPAAIYKIHAEKVKYSTIDTVVINLHENIALQLSSPLVIEKNSGVLQGKVITENGSPVFAAKIIVRNGLNKITATSDVNGLFQMSLKEGAWQIIGEKIGLSQEHSRVVNIVNNMTISLTPDLTLKTQAGLVGGIVSDGTSGIGNVHIRAVPSQGYSYEFSSNFKGNFSLSLLPGVYDLLFNKEGFKTPPPMHLELSPGESISNLVVHMQLTSAEISGVIRSREDAIADAIVTNGETIDISRINGFYKLHVVPGTHALQVIKSEYFLSHPVNVTVSSGEELSNIDIELNSQAATIRGRVISANLPVVNCEILFFMNSDTLSIYSNSAGRFTIYVEAGVWNLLARKEGFADQTTQIALQPGQTIQGIELVLTANHGFVSGRIEDSLGNFLPLATVSVMDRQRQAIANENGNYQLELSPGQLVLLAEKAGYGQKLQEVNLNQNQNIIMNFSLSSFGILVGKITDSNSTPVNHAELIAIQNGDTLRDFSDYAGDYRLFPPGGNYILVADKLGYTANQQSISIQNSQTLIRDIQLDLNPNEIANISGFVSIDNKIPLSGASVTITGKSNLTRQTGSDGKYSLEKLEAGFDYIIKPKEKGFFFLPENRIYNPLTGNLSDQNFVATFYGDLSGNQGVSSFDGSLVLRISAQKDVSPYFTDFPRDSLAGDVSGNQKISSFDASLIFRFSVSLIDRFPAEILSGPVSKQSGPIQFITEWHMLNSGNFELVVFSETQISFYSVDAILDFPSDQLEFMTLKTSTALANFNLVSNNLNGTLNIAMAGNYLAEVSDTLFSIKFHEVENAWNDHKYDLQWQSIYVDEVSANIESIHEKWIPDRFAVSNSYPNPFNQDSAIHLELPVIKNSNTTKLEVEVFNLLGQKVKTIINENYEPGFYRATWQGDSDIGIHVSSGLYFFLVRYAKFQEVKKAILLR